MFQEISGQAITCYSMADNFARAMPDEFKFDTSIDTFTAYKMYIASKPWVASNYLRDESRKPKDPINETHSFYVKGLSV